jgi:Tfp pilus assembly protein PilN
MKPLVNLASSPFRNRRLFWLVILLLFLIPAYFGMQMIESASRLNDDISNQKMKVKAKEIEYKQMEKPVVSNVSISTDENRQLVAANELIARRAFSWSQLLSDIERSLPTTVRVLRVAVNQILPNEREEAFDGSQNAATLTLTVIGQTNQDVTTMINRFHDTGRFKVFPLSKKTIDGTDEIEFELKVEYFPPISGARANVANQIASAKPAEKK